MRQRPFSDGINIEPDGEALLMIQNVAAVKKKGRLDHGAIYFPVIQSAV